MATSKFDARAVINYIEKIEHQIALYESKAEDLNQAYNELINLDSFEGITADTVKTLTKDVHVVLLESVVQAQKYLKERYVNALVAFQEYVDASDDARIEISVLEEIYDEYCEKEKIFAAHANKVEDIAYTIQLKYGDIYTVTQPDYTDCRESFKALIGDYRTKGLLANCIEALEDFDDDETLRAKDADLDGYLDDLELKIVRLENLLEGSNVLATNYVMVNQYIDAFKNGTVLDGTLADTIFSWLECSEDEKLKQVVKSPFYKNLKAFMNGFASASLSCSQGIRFVTENLELLGKNLKELYVKHSDNITDVTMLANTTLFWPMFMTMAIAEKIYPDSEFYKIYSSTFDWGKSFIKGGQTCIVDMGEGILSLPNTVMDLMDGADNLLVSGVNYIRHNGIKTLNEDIQRRVKDILSKLEAVTIEKVDDLSVQVKKMTVNDAFYAAGYVVTFILGGKALKEIIESVKGVESVSIGAETVGETEIIVEGAETAGEAEIIIEGAETAGEAEIIIEGGKATEGVSIEVGAEDIAILRGKLGVPETDTIAVGKTDVKGLEGLVFEGQSPKVRKEAGLLDIDITMPNRPIKSIGKIPSATRHAEEVVANDFVKAVEKQGIPPEEVVGTLKIHQSNPSGVCPTCLGGLGNPQKQAGVIKQLSLKYPNLRIEVTSEVVEGVKPNGRLNFVVKNGQYVK